jgi:ribulose-phosphate 3-epimerase
MLVAPSVLSADFGNLERAATKPLDIHLMVENNTFFVDLFAPLKPGYITFHIEEEKNPHRLVQYIRSLGIKAGVVLNPHTPAEAVEYLLADLDMVLIMSVNPGFGGQKFIPTVVEKVKRLRALCDKINPDCLIEIDGGVTDQNITMLKDAGVDVCVAGSYVFKHESFATAISNLRP